MWLWIIRCIANITFLLQWTLCPLPLHPHPPRDHPHQWSSQSEYNVSLKIKELKGIDNIAGSLGYFVDIRIKVILYLHVIPLQI